MAMVIIMATLINMAMIYEYRLLSQPWFIQRVWLGLGIEPTA